MALIKAGWWQTTWFPSRWWQQDYWLEYGVYVPPTPTHGDVWLSRSVPRPTFPIHLMVLIRNYLESKQQD
jgi:hypothetical protein